mgnify:CR=1 FL=1
MEKKKAKLSLEKRHNLTGWAFLLPASILIFVFCFYPMSQAILLSFRKTGGVFNGVANYARIFKDKTFQQCLFNTFFYFVIQVPIMLVLALMLAQLLNNPKIKGKGIFRTLIFLPCATSLVSYSMIFKSLFAPDGVVNRVLMAIGLSSVDWFQSTWPARWVIVIALIWRWTGYNMVFYLSGLQNIEYSVYEAARIDGSGEFRTFNSIVLPIMKPAIAVQAIFTFVGSWNNYFVPALVIQSKSKMTVPILIATLRGADYMNFDMGKIYMMITVAIVPIIIVYLLLSKYIIAGVTLGGVKE